MPNDVEGRLGEVTTGSREMQQFFGDTVGSRPQTMFQHINNMVSLEREQIMVLVLGGNELLLLARRLTCRSLVNPRRAIAERRAPEYCSRLAVARQM